MLANVKCTKEKSVIHVRLKITKVNHTMNVCLAPRTYVFLPMKWLQLLHSKLYKLTLQLSYVNKDTKWRNTECRRSGYAMRKVAKSTKARTVIHVFTKTMGRMDILYALPAQTCLRALQNKWLAPKSINVKKITRWSRIRKRRNMGVMRRTAALSKKEKSALLANTHLMESTDTLCALIV